MTFGITFSINFPDRLNLVICNTYNAKPFYHFRPLILASKIDHLFSKPFLEHIVSHYWMIFFKNGRFGDPHSKSDVVKNDTKIDKVAPKYCFVFFSGRFILGFISNPVFTKPE